MRRPRSGYFDKGFGGSADTFTIKHLRVGVPPGAFTVAGTPGIGKGEPAPPFGRCAVVGVCCACVSV